MVDTSEAIQRSPRGTRRLALLEEWAVTRGGLWVKAARLADAGKALPDLSMAAEVHDELYRREHQAALEDAATPSITAAQWRRQLADAGPPTGCDVPFRFPRKASLTQTG